MKPRRAKGEGTVYKLPDGRWVSAAVVGYRLVPTQDKADKKKSRRIPRRLKRIGRTKAEAAALLREALAKHHPEYECSLTLREYLAAWLAEGAERWKIATYRNYETWIRLHIVPTLGVHPVGSITKDDVRAWQLHLEKRKLGLNTRSRAHKMAAQAMQPLLDEGKIPYNPFRAAKPPKIPKADVYVPNTDELGRLVAACDTPQLRAIVILALTSVLRVSELCALRYPDDVDLGAAKLYVTASLNRDLKGRVFRDTPKTKSSNRVIALAGVAIEAIRNHIRARSRQKGLRNTPWLFTAGNGQPLERHNFRNRVWGPLLKKAGLPRNVHFHALRHAGISLLLDAGIPVLAVSARAGHADTRMTLDRYGHLVRAGSDREAAAASDRIIAGLMSKSIEPPKNPRAKSKHSFQKKKNARKPIRRKQKSLVEMRRLELLTPYMRSKCSTS